MKQQNEFEPIFQDFVKKFGGEVLPQTSDAKIADYLFREQNIVAELKCLVCDQTAEMNSKLTRVVREVVKKNESLLSLCDGKPLEIAKAPKEISDPWLQILIAPLENVIRDANRQIRSTKERLNLPSAKGLLLIFNQGNLLHNRPQDFRLLVAKILRKKMPSKELKFTNISGVVYFSYETVKTEQQNMSFWASMQIQIAPNEDLTPMEQFQKTLQQGWYSYVERISGRRVRQHAGE
jgi:hypothetical protein